MRSVSPAGSDLLRDAGVLITIERTLHTTTCNSECPSRNRDVSEVFAPAALRQMVDYRVSARSPTDRTGPLTDSPEGGVRADHYGSDSVADVATDVTEPRPHRSRFAKLADLQRRFEDTRVGRWVFTGLIVVILGAQVIANLPDSAIKRVLHVVSEPTKAVNLAQRWAMFAPNPNQRLEYLDVAVTMADGNTRTWTAEPFTRYQRLFVPNRWEDLQENAIRQPQIRPRLARWVVNEVSGPTERPVRVVMTMRFERLLPPGQPGRTSATSKVLYEEELAGQS